MSSNFLSLKMEEPVQELSEHQFNIIIRNAGRGDTSKILECLDIYPELITRIARCKSSLLHALCEGGDVNCVKAIIEKGANVNAKDIHGWTPLMFAANSGNDNIIEYLIHNSNVNIHDIENQGRNALMLASYTGNHKVCHLLLEKGSNPNYICKYSTSDSVSFSALRFAAERGHIHILLLFIKYKGNLLQNLGHNITPIDMLECEDLENDSNRTIEDERKFLLDCFSNGPHPDMCWKRRWPIINVMVGYDFRPLEKREKEIQRQRNALLEMGENPPPILLNTPEQRRAYYMLLIFRCDGLLRCIVGYL